MTRGLSILGFVIAITLGALSFTPNAIEGNETAGTALAFGFLLLAAIQTGHIFAAFKLPRLTGHIVCGMVFGPFLLGILTQDMVEALTLVKGVAVGLIALLAGCELNFKVLKPKLKSIGVISFFSFFWILLLLFGFFWFLLPFLPFGALLTTFQRATVALLCANILCAFSPPVVMGIISETQSSGPLSELSLSIVVLADLAIVILFSLANFTANLAFPDVGNDSGLLGLVIHIAASGGIGLVIGAVLALYIQRVGTRVGLLVFAIFFVVAQAGVILHIDPLLTGLTAGLFLENLSPVSGHEVIKETEPATLPTFAVFFAVIGAELKLDSFLAAIHYCLLAAVIRCVALYIAAAMSKRFIEIDNKVLWLTPMGLLSQAGVAIALANLLSGSFPSWGPQVATLLLGIIVVNQFIGPILFRVALTRANEVDKKQESHTEDEQIPHGPLTPAEEEKNQEEKIPEALPEKA